MMNEYLSNDNLVEKLSLHVSEEEKGIRLDKYLHQKINDTSRQRIKMAIKNQNIAVNNKPAKPSYKVNTGDKINIVISIPIKHKLKAENIPINIIYEDRSIIVINKEPNIVVHPGAKNLTGTLANALFFHINKSIKNSQKYNKIGIVHRIDKDTSGIMIFAKDEFATENLAKQFFDRTVFRKYIALVWGVPEKAKAQIKTNIARDINNRVIMSVFPENGIGKKAITNYEVTKSFSNNLSLVSCKLETGRTHQIRVHFKHIGNPIFNDKVYGGDKILKGILTSKYKKHIQDCFKVMNRQALHSSFISFEHPYSKKRLSFEIDLPNDMKKLLELWENFFD